MTDPVLKPSLMTSLVKGKIIRFRKYQNHYYTALVIPSPDPYARPATVELRSSARLGQLNDLIDAVVTLSGYNGKPYQVVEDGESRTVTPVHNVLEVVE